MPKGQNSEWVIKSEPTYSFNSSTSGSSYGDSQFANIKYSSKPTASYINLDKQYFAKINIMNTLIKK
jgi:hypothetical protein